jgi:hypothetical protein
MRRLEMLQGWVAIARGRSDAHRPQDVGRRFDPAGLEGYFIDLTSKTEIAGPTDETGLPLVRFGGTTFHHPTNLFQLGLGHWDRWLIGGRGDDGDRRRFIDVAEWAVANMDSNGGWPVFPQLGLRTDSPYSAMTQGLAVSVLVRANEMGEPRTGWMDAAAKAAELMIKPTELGGTARRVGDGLVLEEGVVTPPNTVLNGWLFALFGLRDLAISADGDAAWVGAVAASRHALLEMLPRFDVGWWSLYDTSRHLASPFYHRLHVAQLIALERAFPVDGPQVATVRMRWEAALASRWSTTRAIAAKASQQLRTPPPRVR